MWGRARVWAVWLVLLGACDGGPTATPCDVDDDCAAGRFCRPGFGCDVECLADVDCAALGGGVCDLARGRCVTDAPDAGMPRMDAGGDAGGGACDVDGDGHRNGDCGGGDCDDTSPAIHPDAAEVCDAADRDEDCDPSTFGARDTDADGSIDDQCCNDDVCGDDCDDARDDVRPDANEVCDDVDQDCDEAIDEDVGIFYYRDDDGDGFGQSADQRQGCGEVPYSATAGGDCDDANVARFPGQTETCNTRDDDCDLTIDEELPALFFRDCDGDGQGDASDPGTTDCDPDPCSGHSAVGVRGDCDDTRAGVFTGAAESCNGIDDDCDASVDEGLTAVWYRDCDGDGRGDDADGGTTTCAPAACGTRPAVAVRGDCDDGNAARFNGNPELCDGHDNDCNGTVDDLASVAPANRCVSGTGNRSCGDASCGGAAGTQICQNCQWISAISSVAGDCVRDGNRDCSPGATDSSVCGSTGAPGPDGAVPSCVTARTCNGSCRWGGCPAPPGETVCNYRDDDCDSAIDDGLARCCYRGWSWNTPGTNGLGAFSSRHGSTSWVSGPGYEYPVLVSGGGMAGSAFLGEALHYASFNQMVLGMTVNNISAGDGYAGVINTAASVGGGGGAMGIPDGQGLAFIHDYFNSELRIVRIDGGGRPVIASTPCGRRFGDVYMTITTLGSVVSVVLGSSPTASDYCSVSADSGSFYVNTYGRDMRYGVSAGTGAAQLHVELSYASLRRSGVFGSVGVCDTHSVFDYCDGCP